MPRQDWEEADECKAFDDEGKEYDCDVAYNEWYEKPRRGQRRP